MSRRRQRIQARVGFTRRELCVLWYLKKHGPLVKKDSSSILTTIAVELDIPLGSLRGVLSGLEARSIVLRTYAHGKREQFETQGFNPCTRIELVDPNMELPPPPPPLPLGVVIAQENVQLAERVAHEPSVDDVIIALVSRIREKDDVIAKLQDIVEQQANENLALRKEAAEAKRPPRSHLSQDVRDVLTEDQWNALRGKS